MQPTTTTIHTGIYEKMTPEQQAKHLEANTLKVLKALKRSEKPLSANELREHTRELPNFYMFFIRMETDGLIAIETEVGQHVATLTEFGKEYYEASS